MGQDGVYPVKVRLTNANGFSSTASSTVTVANLAPVVALASDGPKPENAAVTVSGTIGDPGWLENLGATIDWDGGGSDDDTTTCATVVVTVTNVAPTATIDEGATVLVNGVPTVVTEAGTSVPFSGRSTDPGSDDLQLSWDWNDGPPSPDVSTNYLNDPAFDPDPDPSPTIHSRDVTDAQHAFAACLYDVGFAARDDDSGSTTDTVKVIVTGNSTMRWSAGFWLQQARRPAQIAPATVDCYLLIVDYVSSVFGPLTRGQAAAILKAGEGTTTREQFDRQLLAALLNFANGAPDYDTLVDTDGDHVGDTPFLEFIAAAEAARLNPATTDDELRALKDVLETINLAGA